jgi:outer membrane receptor protein involved in Fe transport
MLMEDIERIEIVRGPNAAVYGANAYFGVINVITTSPSKMKASTARINLGDNGQRQLSGQYAGQSGAWDYRLSLGYQADDGFKNIYDSQQKKIAAVNAEYRPNGRDIWQFGAGYNKSQHGRGDANDTIDQPHTDFIHAAFAQTRWQRIIAADSEFSIQLYHNAYDLESALATLPIASLGGQRFNLGGPIHFFAGSRLAHRGWRRCASRFGAFTGFSRPRHARNQRHVAFVCACRVVRESTLECKFGRHAGRYFLYRARIFTSHRAELSSYA